MAVDRGNKVDESQGIGSVLKKSGYLAEATATVDRNTREGA